VCVAEEGGCTKNQKVPGSIREEKHVLRGTYARVRVYVRMMYVGLCKVNA
jgi:hypothetical protein